MFEIYDISKIPILDLHGEIKDFAIIRINDFINDNIRLKNRYIGIIHGKGSGVLKNATQDTLRKNKFVEDFKIYYFNDGMTIAKLKETN